VIRRFAGAVALVFVLWLLWGILCFVALNAQVLMTGAALEIVEVIFWCGVIAIPLIVWFWGRSVQENPDC
jgi:hypothetical protein